MHVKYKCGLSTERFCLIQSIFTVDQNMIVNTINHILIVPSPVIPIPLSPPLSSPSSISTPGTLYHAKNSLVLVLQTITLKLYIILVGTLPWVSITVVKLLLKI